MAGIIVTTPPTVELPPGNASGPQVLPGVTYQYALLNIPQTWGAKQTFPLGNISLNAADITGLSSVPVIASQLPAFTGDVTTVAGTTATTLGKTHLVVYTVAPSGASASDKLRADYVGDGTNDQTAIQNAFAAAGSSNAAVVVMPGNYIFGDTCNIPARTNCYLYAEGATFNGAGGTKDTFSIASMVRCNYYFGTINHSGTGSAIHTVQFANGSWLTAQSIHGSSHQGKGIYIDASTTGSSTGYIRLGWLDGFDKGIHFYSKTVIDTHVVWLNYGFNCNYVIYDETDVGASVASNAMTWNVNLDTAWTGSASFAGIWTNGTAHVINGTVGSTVGGTYGPNIKLDTAHGFAASAITLNVTPLAFAHESGNVVNSSGNIDHIMNVGMPISLATGGYGNNLVKWSGGVTGQLDNTGLSLGTIGAAKTLVYCSATGVLASLATANNGVLVTDGSGNPAIATTTPSGLAIATPNITGVTNGSNAATGSVGELITAGIGNLFGAPTSTVTITIASPAVITWTSHNLSGVSPVVFTTTGALPTGITSGTVYWTIPSSITTNTFQIATSVANALAGTAVNTSGSQSGTHTGTVGVPLTSGTPTNGCAVSLTAGDWDISGTGFFDGAGSTTLNYLVSGESTATGSFSGSAGGGGSSQTYGGSTPFGTLSVLTQQFGPQRISLASTTSIYGVIQGGFGVSTLSGFAFLRARRVR